MQKKDFGPHILYSVAFFVVFVASSGLAFALPARFIGPEGAAPDNKFLNSLEDLDTFLRHDETQEQSVQSSMLINNSGTRTVFLGTDEGALSSGILPGTAVSGVGSSAATSAGIYGYAVGNGSVGVVGQTLDSIGFAGSFEGAVSIRPSLGGNAGSFLADGEVQSPRFSGVSNSYAFPGVSALGGIELIGDAEALMHGDVSGAAGYGIYGNSDAAVGIVVDVTIAEESFPGDVYGVYGVSTFGPAGIYAMSEGGNGAEAAVYSASDRPGVEGEGIDSGYGVSATGSAFSGFFDGDVSVSGGSVFIGEGTNVIELSQLGLQQLIAWCQGKGECP